MCSSSPRRSPTSRRWRSTPAPPVERPRPDRRATAPVRGRPDRAAARSGPRPASSPPPSSTTRSRRDRPAPARPSPRSPARSRSPGSSPPAAATAGRVRVARDAGGAVVGVSIAFEPGRLADPRRAPSSTSSAGRSLAGPLPVRRGHRIRPDGSAPPTSTTRTPTSGSSASIPTRQGRGVGRALLAELARPRPTRVGVPTYLETGTMENVA